MPKAFEYAITRIPAQTFDRGITSAKLGLPSYKSVLKQHRSYTQTLKSIGLKVVEHLEVLDLENVQIINAGTVPESFTSQIREYEPTHVLMVDAAHIEEEPGVSRVIPTQLICDGCLSTHKLPLTVLTNYLDKTLGAKVGLVGIQPLSILFGEEMNPELVKAAEEVADAIAKALLER